MKRICIFVLIFAALLSFTACDGKKLFSDIFEPTASNAQTESTDGLSQLRADMKPPVIAVANFYFPELSEDFGIMDYLLDEYPQWVAEKDFIRDMPDERIVLTCGYDTWANLVCVVPYDPASTVTVKVVRILEEGTDRQENIVYSSKSGEPILLLADTSDYVTVSVEVIDSTGRGVTWVPYWDNANPIPEDGYYGHLVMEFTPYSEKSDYDRLLDAGWYVPDTSILANGWWQSDHGYALELYYDPGEAFDGMAYLSSVDESGEYTLEYMGNWVLIDGKLKLDVHDTNNGNVTIQGNFPVLTDPWGAGYLAIGRTDDGSAIPYFYDDQQTDELWPVSGNMEDPYDYAISQGWRLPELAELVDSNWQSYVGYALELMDDSVPGDNGGRAILYDVDEIGAYTESYSGSWHYEDGMLHLSLVPANGNGVFVDDSFPVLMLDGQLWIGRNSSGLGLPHFYSDMLADVLDQPKG